MRLFSTQLVILTEAAFILALAGCGSSTGRDWARTFGFVRDAPDEFAVTTQPPLAMPPDFTLRPPRPGAPRPQAVPETRQAEEALVPQLTLEPPTSAPTVCAAAPSRSSTATAIPSPAKRRAIARPMPPPAPVTNAMRPCNA